MIDAQEKAARAQESREPARQAVEGGGGFGFAAPFLLESARATFAEAFAKGREKFLRERGTTEFKPAPGVLDEIFGGGQPLRPSAREAADFLQSRFAFPGGLQAPGGLGVTLPGSVQQEIQEARRNRELIVPENPEVLRANQVLLKQIADNTAELKR